MASGGYPILISSDSDDAGGSDVDLPAVGDALRQTCSYEGISKRKISPLIQEAEINLTDDMEEEDPDNGRDAKRRKIEEDKENRKQIRERKKEERQKEKRLDKIVRQAEKESRKESQPAERTKQMIVTMGTSLTEDSELMMALLPQLQDMGTSCKTLHEETITGAVRWKRKNIIRTLNGEQTGVVEDCQEVDEPDLLVIMAGKKLVEFVAASKQTTLDPSTSTLTLLEYAQSVMKCCPLQTKILIAVNDIEAALRAQKTQRNRRFRAAVHSNDTITNTSVTSRIDCEEVIVDLQLKTGCCVHLCSSTGDVADLIATYTKALANKLYKKENLFSFYDDITSNITKKALEKSANKYNLIWQNQLMQFPGVSNHVAAAIAGVYHSPGHLIRAYKMCKSTDEAELLLSDIQVRRGAGIIATNRRVGQSLSKKIHFSFVSTDPDSNLPN
jgi:crossover junction endonuclease EME1